MKNYGYNILLTALASFFIAVITFLVGNEVGQPSVASAMTSGILSGISISLSYMFGKLMEGTAWNKEMGTRLVIMLITGILFGLFGGWTMTLY